MSFNFIEDKTKKIFFIGIGGIGMSGLAEILLEHDFSVSGSDMNSSPMTNKLEKNGAIVHIGHKAENIEGAELVVYTAAISKDNPELLRAKELNIPMLNRAEFLGFLMKDYKYNIAISGTHGKTTTTSMFSHIALHANLDPTILVGGNLDLIKGNVRTGKSEYFITEACEYKRSFLKFFPYIGVILNVDADHLDYYKDINDIKAAFTSFIKLIPSNGYLIACAEDKNLKEILPTANCNLITYGIDEGDIRAKNIVYSDTGCATFDVYKDNNKLFTINLNIPGRHNLLNALASIGVALSLNLPDNDIIEGLSGYFGTHRRFENKGAKDGVTVIDDYAHHPTEIKATLAAAMNYPHKKIYCVFQPHTYSRTITLFKEFTNCFSDVDELVLADIYAAREKDTGIISSTMLGDKIRETGLNCINFHNFEDIVEYLKASLKPGDLLITMGAGDVYKIGEMFLK